MKTFTLLLVSALFSLTACATDDADDGKGLPGLRPGYKPALGDIANDDTLPDDRADIDDSFDSGTGLDPRKKLPGDVEWAEDLLIGGVVITRIRRVDGTEELLDADGEPVGASR